MVLHHVLSDSLAMVPVTSVPEDLPTDFRFELLCWYLSKDFAQFCEAYEVHFGDNFLCLATFGLGVFVCVLVVFVQPLSDGVRLRLRVRPQLTLYAPSGAYGGSTQ